MAKNSFEETAKNQEHVFNAIAEERAKLNSYRDRKGQGSRKTYTIGIVNALASYEYLPLWYTLFSTLGYTVFVSDQMRLNQFSDEAAKTIPSENACMPAKTVHACIFELLDRGVDVLFAPYFPDDSRCAVLCGYTRVVANNIPALVNGNVKLISPFLSNVDLNLLYDKPEEFIPVRDALVELDPSTAPSVEEFSRALHKALAIQRKFEAEMVATHPKKVEELFKDKKKEAVVIAARPYHLTETMLKGIDEKFAKHGFMVFSPRAIKASLRDVPQSDTADPTLAHNLFLSSIASTSLDEYSIHMVFLHCSNCGYDAISIAEAQRIMVNGNRRCAVINLDETEEKIEEQIESVIIDFKNEKSCHDLQDCETLSPSQAIEFLVDSYQEESLRLDTQKRFSDLPNSLCNTISILFNDSFASFESNPNLNEIHLPTICRGCLVDSLPNILSQNLKRDVTIYWDEKWELTPEVTKTGRSYLAALSHSTSALEDLAESHQESHRVPDVSTKETGTNNAHPPTVGFIGNPLLCFNPTIVKVLHKYVEKNGGQLLLPDADNFLTRDFNYLKQLETYNKKGVDSVLCLQDINCVKEHVNIRGTLQAIQQRYPKMRIIAIEFDSDFSPRTLDNRVCLAICRIFDDRRLEQISIEEEALV